MLLQDPEWLKDSILRHGFFTRQGGVSQGLFQSLNCGYGSGDDRGTIDQNRAIALKSLGLEKSKLFILHQVHSNFAVMLNAQSDIAEKREADGAVTESKDVAIGILTADCAPILFYDPIKKIIGAAHAGWKGARDGIAENTARVMHSMGSDFADIRAVIGPCIQQASYEVRQDFYDSLARTHSGAEVFFKKMHKEGHYHFNLPGYIMHRLAKIGVTNLHHFPNDSYAEEDLFFSHRRATQRQEPQCGRMISIIALKG